MDITLTNSSTNIQNFFGMSHFFLLFTVYIECLYFPYAEAISYKLKTLYLLTIAKTLMITDRALNNIFTKITNLIKAPLINQNKLAT